MYKAELKTLYGHYGDVEKLVDDVRVLLNKYDHTNTEEGVCAMLNTFFLNKQKLIELFAGSSNYIGDFRIAVDMELDRELDAREIRTTHQVLDRLIPYSKFFLKYADENEKQLEDYLMEVKDELSLSDFKKENIFEELQVHNTSKFDRIEGYTLQSKNDMNLFRELLSYFKSYYNSSINERAILDLCNSPVKLANGLKTSRALNRICTHYGVHKIAGYDRAFAAYADSVSALKRKLKFFISVNPMDYLMMSFGRTWSSCHTIDKRNRRRMENGYSGMYCGGTMSYMLDSVSIVTFVYQNIPEDFEEGKIYRNMFHFNDGALVQGRIYPQGNDGATDLYKIFRSVMQKEMSNILGIENKWTLSKKKPYEANIISEGAHYRDYTNFSDCNVSYAQQLMSELPSSTLMTIGHTGVCVNCGGESYSSGCLICDDCQ